MRLFDWTSLRVPWIPIQGGEQTDLKHTKEVT